MNFRNLLEKWISVWQISYTESFNIVASDFVNNDVLVIVSEAIEWMPWTKNINDRFQRYN